MFHALAHTLNDAAIVFRKAMVFTFGPLPGAPSGFQCRNIRVNRVFICRLQLPHAIAGLDSRFFQIILFLHNLIVVANDSEASVFQALLGTVEAIQIVSCHKLTSGWLLSKVREECGGIHA